MSSSATYHIEFEDSHIEVALHQTGADHAVLDVFALFYRTYAPADAYNPAHLARWIHEHVYTMTDRDRAELQEITSQPADRYMHHLNVSRLHVKRLLPCPAESKDMCLRPTPLDVEIRYTVEGREKADALARYLDMCLHNGADISSGPHQTPLRSSKELKESLNPVVHAGV